MTKDPAFDASERQRFEDALQASEDRYRRLFEDGPCGNLVVSAAGAILDCNGPLAETLGADRVDQLVGRPFGEFFAEPRQFVDLVAAATRNGAASGEVEMLPFRGNAIHVSLTLTAVCDADGALVSLRGSLIEITETKMLQMGFLGSLRMEAIGRLAGGIAHDFNNLLTVIGGHSERLIDALGPNDALTNSVKAIQQATGRATALTRQLLAFSRRQVFNLRSIAMHRLLTGAELTLQNALGDRILLQLELPTDLPDITGDPSQIEHVIISLALNAREAMPQGGTLRIRVDVMERGGRPLRQQPWLREGTYVRVQMIDDGVGMNAATKAHLFEPFFTTKQLGKGSGLGLSAVYGIVKQSNGFIWVDSEVGKGACFTVLFPVSERSARSTDDRGGAVFETILVVEGDENIRMLVADSLRRRGYRVLDAATGAQAADMFLTHNSRIHLLLSDVSTGTGSGPILADRLKSSNPLLQVLYMSGSTATFLNEHPAMTGVPFIQKPFTLQSLADKVRDVLDSGEGRG